MQSFENKVKTIKMTSNFQKLYKDGTAIQSFKRFYDHFELPYMRSKILHAIKSKLLYNFSLT